MAIRLSTNRRVIPVVLALAMATCSVLPAAAATSSLKPLVIQTSDVSSAFGSGFKVLALRKMTTVDMRGMQSVTTKSALSEVLKGWIEGYFSSFYRPSVTKAGKAVSPQSPL